MKFSIFTGEKNLCILHGQIFVMYKHEKKEGLYYPGSENKGADQLCSYCTADLRLCFRICKSLVFSYTGSSKIFEG